MSNHSSALPMVAAAICSAPLADFGVGGTSGSKVVVDTKVAGGYMRGNLRARLFIRGRGSGAGFCVNAMPEAIDGSPTFAKAYVGPPSISSDIALTQTPQGRLETLRLHS